jgi:uncharacterized protein
LATLSTHKDVKALLGRDPRGPFEVVLRDARGGPVVIRNGPVLDDGTPMPTRYWLIGKEAKLAVDRLEAAGGVSKAAAAVDLAELERAHRRYAAERDSALPADWVGSRPTGGVGGTRRGVKCLHAHYAWYLVGGDDPVGRWVAQQLAAQQLAAQQLAAQQLAAQQLAAQQPAAARLTEDAGQAGSPEPDGDR